LRCARRSRYFSIARRCKTTSTVAPVSRPVISSIIPRGSYRRTRSGKEIFGPVISAIPFTDVAEMIRRDNATNFGLGSGVWTRDLSKAHLLAEGLRRLRMDQWLPGDGSRCAVRRLQDERLWPRVRHPADSGGLEHQHSLDRDGLNGSGDGFSLGGRRRSLDHEERGGRTERSL
jgi:hypothetical protein